MSRRAVTGAVAVVVAVIAAVSAPPAVARPVLPPVPQPYVGAPSVVVDRSEGTLTLRVDVLTSGLQALVDARQWGSWGGQGVLTAASGAAVMVCIGSGYSTGSIISEYSNTTIGLTCTTATSKPKLTCQLLFTRLGAGLEIHGTCSLVTAADSYTLMAEGSLAWATTQTAPVTKASLAGSIVLVDPSL